MDKPEIILLCGLALVFDNGVEVMNFSEFGEKSKEESSDENEFDWTFREDFWHRNDLLSIEGENYELRVSHSRIQAREVGGGYLIRLLKQNLV